MFSASCLRQAAASGQSTYSSSSAALQPVRLCPALTVHASITHYHHDLCIFICLFDASLCISGEYPVQLSAAYFLAFFLLAAVELEFISFPPTVTSVMMISCCSHVFVHLSPLTTLLPPWRQNGSPVSQLDLLDPSVTLCWTVTTADVCLSQLHRIYEQNLCRSSCAVARIF